MDQVKFVEDSPLPKRTISLLMKNSYFAKFVEVIKEPCQKRIPIINHINQSIFFVLKVIVVILPLNSSAILKIIPANIYLFKVNNKKHQKKM